MSELFERFSLSSQDRATAGSPGASPQLIEQLLTVVRRHLGMEVAFIGRVRAGVRTFEFIDTGDSFRPIHLGESDPLADSYCGRVLSGEIPPLIPDASEEPGVADLAATWDLPIGAHLSVPIVTPDGRTYGTLCCFSRLANAALTQRDVDVVSMFAGVIGAHLEPLAERYELVTAARTAITQVLDGGGPDMALQPIINLSDGTVAGYEALARFPSASGGTQHWFETAAACGLATALESSAVHAALRMLPHLPEAAYLAVNVSAAALLDSGSIIAMITGSHASRLVLELTEHSRIENQQRLNEALDLVRRAGARIAVDDAGSGYAGLQRILALRPEVLKLDRTLVDGVAGHVGQQAMCEAMVGFSRRVGADLIAEGVETEDDLNTLRRLGVSHAQGYLLGRPSFLRDHDDLQFNSRTHSHRATEDRPPWAEDEQLARPMLTHPHHGHRGDVVTHDTSTDSLSALMEGLADTIAWAEECRHITGPDSEQDADELVRAALRLHRQSAIVILESPPTEQTQ